MKTKYQKIIVLLIITSLLIIIFSSVSGNINLEKIDENQEEKVRQYLFFEKFLGLYVKLCRIPSMSTCIIDYDEIIWSKNYGYLDPEIFKESDENSIYLVMSISKPIAATALMQLYEKGLFDLDGIA